MLISSALNGGFKIYVGAEALEFLGAYLVGRAFVFGPSNLRTFVKALWRVTVVIIALMRRPDKVSSTDSASSRL
jgi:hypothetical protein